MRTRLHLKLAVPAAVRFRLYETLFKSEDPGSMDNWLEDINPESLSKLSGCVMSPRLAAAKVRGDMGGGCDSRERGNACTIFV